MVEVKIFKIGRSVTLRLNEVIELTLFEDKYKELILAQRTTEGSDNYYLYYHALKCEISEQSGQELIALGARVEDLDDLKNFIV